MSGRSPIDSLRRLAPVSDEQAAAMFGDAGHEELLAGVTDQPYRPPADVLGRRPGVAARSCSALAVVAAAATAAAAWAVLHGSAAQETTSVQCLIGAATPIIPVDLR